MDRKRRRKGKREEEEKWREKEIWSEKAGEEFRKRTEEIEIEKGGVNKMIEELIKRIK